MYTYVCVFEMHIIVRILTKSELLGMLSTQLYIGDPADKIFDGADFILADCGKIVLAHQGSLSSRLTSANTFYTS